MDSVSHTTVASCLLDYFEQTEGVAFDRKAFYFGNLKPDLKGEYLSKRHYPSLMFEEVMQKLRTFIENFRVEAVNGVKLSEALGEICHYITDFFTFPHNDTIYEHGLLAHYIYEKRMAFGIKDHVQTQSVSAFAEIADMHLPLTTDGLIRAIASRHERYTSQAAHSIADDVWNACAALALVVGSVIQMLFVSEEPERQTA